jgi:DNA-binding MarR family transcriptional regulator
MQLWRDFLTAADAAIGQVGAALTRGTGLSVPDFQVLIRIDAAGGTQLLQQTLGDDLGWSDSRLSHQLRRMEQRGLISRQSAGVGRAMSTQVTEDGHRLLQGALPVHAEAVKNAFLRDLTADDRRRLASILNKVISNDRLTLHRGIRMT